MNHDRTWNLRRPAYKPPPGMPDFTQISADNMRLIMGCADRAVRVAKAYHEVNGGDSGEVMELQPLAVALDFAIAHIRRGLDVRALFHSGELEFIAEHTAIEKNIDRANFALHESVMLRFANNGTRPFPTN